ncbi:MAG TPA: hypothetical protein VK993_12490 [Chthoniobacterales bacterium]|nr:hypothetical protein [Chthoniobacterales bacterium]
MTSRRRAATAGDTAVIARIHREAFFNALPHMAVLHTPEDDLAFYATVVFPRCEIWIADVSGQAAGFLANRAGWIDHLTFYRITSAADWQHAVGAHETVRTFAPRVDLPVQRRRAAIL